MQKITEALTTEENVQLDRWLKLVNNGSISDQRLIYVRAGGTSGDRPLLLPMTKVADLPVDAPEELVFAAGLAERLFEAWASDPSRAIFASPYQRSGEDVDGYEQITDSDEIFARQYGSVLLMPQMVGG